MFLIIYIELNGIVPIEPSLNNQKDISKHSFIPIKKSNSIINDDNNTKNNVNQNSLLLNEINNKSSNENPEFNKMSIDNLNSRIKESDDGLLTNDEVNSNKEMSNDLTNDEVNINKEMSNILTNITASPSQMNEFESEKKVNQRKNKDIVDDYYSHTPINKTSEARIQSAQTVLTSPTIINSTIDNTKKHEEYNDTFTKETTVKLPTLQPQLAHSKIKSDEEISNEINNNDNNNNIPYFNSLSLKDEEINTTATENDTENVYESNQKSEDDEDVLELVYDSVLNCYFDPVSGKYYEVMDNN